jgi:hypothetical protein
MCVRVDCKTPLTFGRFWACCDINNHTTKCNLTFGYLSLAIVLGFLPPISAFSAQNDVLVI